MADQSLSQTQALRQEQILAPQQIQSLEILQLPILQLQEKLNKELEENPLLEQVSSPGHSDIGDPVSEMASRTVADGPEDPHGKDDDESLARLFNSSVVSGGGSLGTDVLPGSGQPADDSADGGASDDSFSPADEGGGGEEDFSSAPGLEGPFEGFEFSGNDSGSAPSADENERRQKFFDSLSAEPSLQDQLLQQLRLSDASPEMFKLAEMIIGSIDETGYFRAHPADVSIACGAGVAEVEKALEFVQTFDPPGIGARNLRECLMLQLKRKGLEKSPLYTLVKKYMDELAGHKYNVILRDMRLDMGSLSALLAELKRLSPYPGSAVSSEKPVYIVPELSIVKEGDKYTVISNDDRLPRLRVSQKYLDMLENPSTPAETKNYIRTKLTSINNLKKCIEQRQKTLKNIASVIVDAQYDFFEKGLEHLRPFTMQQAADKIGVHETTVSRAIAGKYAQTPAGLLEFKFFFTTGYKSSDGGEFSSKSVKEMIRDLVLAEDSAHPLSDSEIVDILDKKGIKIARRTVAKYREEMNIQPSHMRKEL
jgi:RNA polymerase sigma-54 factor